MHRSSDATPEINGAAHRARLAFLGRLSADAALRLLVGGPRRCVHLSRRPREFVVCIGHPEAGSMCHWCSQLHRASVAHDACVRCLTTDVFRSYMIEMEHGTPGFTSYSIGLDLCRLCDAESVADQHADTHRPS